MEKKYYQKPKLSVNKLKVDLYNRINDSYDSIDSLLSGPLLASGGGCFTHDTYITLVNNKKKKIKDINPNDKVLSYDEEKGLFKENRIKQLLIHNNSYYEYNVINNTIKVTPNHRLYVNNKWLRVDQVKINDYLLTEKRTWIKVKKIEGKGKVKKVYNLHLVNKPHNFFAEKILVHNGPAEQKKS